MPNYDEPHVSVVLTTRDRPRFLAIALRNYAAQTYSNRELIVVDDGLDFPVDERMIRDLGGRLVRQPNGSTIGAKLNAGIEIARGPLCQKMDDDDWYASNFLETMVNRRLRAETNFCHPTMTFVMPFLFFELSAWEIRRSIPNNVPGATLMFDRDDWRDRPFRNLAQDEDVWYFRDHRRLGRAFTPVEDVDIFLAVRHHGATGDRGHTWTHQHGRQTLEQYLQSRPLHECQPADLLPEWGLRAYREIRARMIARDVAEPDVSESEGLTS
ncbi:MAG TPA: glycosyltransferase family A protein [Nitrolancea sp.]|nr:glycosyltransferase family A protein [Nitrolancea sp.]